MLDFILNFFVSVISLNSFEICFGFLAVIGLFNIVRKLCF